MTRQIALIALLGTFTATSHALDFKNWSAGRQILSPSAGVGEICVLPKPLPGADYKKSDAKKEEALCGLSFYETNGVCPKLTSTNPGVELYDLKAPLTKADFEKTCANPVGDGAKKVAKFKQSTSCSYAPSILAYYHMSRALGGAGHVPVAVVRTMEAAEHLKVAKEAAQILIKRPKELITRDWTKLLAGHSNMAAVPEVFDARNDLVYGALQVNPRSELKYSEFNKFPSYEVRYTSFMSKPQVVDIQKSVPVASLLGKDLHANIQLMVQYKDLSDLILMDSLLNQQDRIGNIHYECQYYLLNQGVLVGQADTKCAKPELPAKDDAKTPAYDDSVLVKEMLMKDNDCGVAKSNKMAELKAFDKLRHMSAATYAAFLTLADTLQTAEGQAWLKTEALFTDKDVASVAGNALRMKAVAQANCRSGALRLDLDLDAMLAGKLSADTRGLCQ